VRETSVSRSPVLDAAADRAPDRAICVHAKRCGPARPPGIVRLLVALASSTAVSLLMGGCGGDREARDALVSEWVEKYGGDVACVDQALGDVSQREAEGLLRLVREEPVSGFTISIELGDAMSDAFACGQ
jgi:hypothetical protein